MGANQSDHECAICANDSVDLHILPCTHAMCAECLGRMFDDTDNMIRCPFCRTEFTMSREQMEALPKKASYSVMERFERLFSRQHEQKITNDTPVEEQPTSSAEQYLPEYESDNNNSESEIDLSDISSIADSEPQQQARRQQRFRTTPTAQRHEQIVTQSRDARRDARSPVVVMNFSSTIRVQQVPPGGERLARKILKKAEKDRRKREMEALAVIQQQAERRSRRSGGRSSSSNPVEVQSASHRNDDGSDYARRAAEQELRVKSLVDRFRATPEAKEKVSRFILSIQSTTAM